MNKKFSESGFEDYLYWQLQDRKTLKKVNNLIKDIERNGADIGIGKPKPLKGNLQGWYSRQIDEKNRLIYRIVDESLEISQCRSHYGDK